MMHGINEAGSRWQDSGNWHVAYLNRNGDKRNLNLNWIHNDFNSNCRFLVSRQSLHDTPVHVAGVSFCGGSILRIQPPNIMPADESLWESCAN